MLLQRALALHNFCEVANCQKRTGHRHLFELLVVGMMYLNYWHSILPIQANLFSPFSVPSLTGKILWAFTNVNMRVLQLHNKGYEHIVLVKCKTGAHV